jgi:hypothetical protein
MTDKVLNLACEEVYKLARSRLALSLDEQLEAGEGLPSEGLSDIVDIYESAMSLLPRLQFCAAVFNLIPGLENRISDDVNRTAYSFNLDILVLHSALEMLDPKGGDMLSKEAREEWTNRVTTLATWARQLEGLVVSKEEQTAPDKELLESIRRKSLRLEIMRVFLKHIMQENVNIVIRETVCKHLRLIFMALKEPDFFSGPQTFKKIKHAIDSYCTKVGEAFLGHNKIIKEWAYVGLTNFFFKFL